MSIFNEVKVIVVDRLEKLHDCLSNEHDLRNCLSLLPSIAFPLKGFLEISSDPTKVFMAYVVMDQLGIVQSTYDGRTEGWYELNNTNVTELKVHLLTFTANLIRSITEEDESGVLDAVKTFFVEFHRLSRSISKDISRK